MKKVQRFLTLIILVGVSFILANTVYATTWYVRTDGGSSTQCTGTTNAAYPGSGSLQACAFNNPSWVLGSMGVSGVMAGGDTLIIDDTNHSTGGQAQYMIGYGMPNVSTSNCNLYSPYQCTLNAIPSGKSATSPTTIEGSSYSSGCATKPQLWGTEGVQQVLNVSGSSNVVVSCLELTDHSNCGWRVGSPTCTENYNNNSNGPWAKNGVYGAGGESNLTFQNMDVHGFANRGFLMGGINGLTFSYVNMDGNYMSNWDGDVGESGSVSYNSGTILLDHVKNRFAGCSESYPRSSSFNTADYKNCTDQNANPPGYGDGVGMYVTGGNWVVTDSEFSHNTQDGLDILYHDGTGSVTIQRSLFEGNDGNQAKMTSPNTDIENSIFIGNCNYLANNSKVLNTGSWVSCRAYGDTLLLTATLSGTYKVYNSTFYADGNSDILFNNRLGTCNGSETYKFRNNIYVGNGSSDLYINELGGSCATPPLDTDYSIIYNASGSACPSGAHNKCATNPDWVNPISQSASSNVANVALSGSSPAIGAGQVIAGISTLDYTDKDRGGSAWDIGAIQYATSGPPPTGSLPTVSITSPANQTTLGAGSNVSITATASETGGTIASVSFYNGTTLLGTDTTSPYNFTWSNVPAGSYSLTAKATDINAATTTSNPVAITVTSAAAPVVSITSPANGSTLTAGSNIVIAASASETNGTIASINMYNGSTMLWTGTTAPCSYTWANVPAGTYTLTAKATDSKGVSTTSSPITVTVATPSVPVVAITSPANGTSYTAGSSISIIAAASETNGTIATVYFYAGTTLLGTDSSGQYNVVWTNVPGGTYALTAKATDTNGVSTTSSPITVTVTGGTTTNKPVVAITSPANGSTLPSGPITVSGTASEAGGTITQVQFLNGAYALNYTGTSSPYSHVWPNVQPGTYTLTAKATDANGVTTTSSPVTFTVTSAVASAPVVAISSPANGSTLPSGSITVSGIASETNGTITQVQFFNGAYALNYTGTSSPYSHVWPNVQPGTYTLTAKATDANGVTTTSSPVTITVTAAVAASKPVVAITSPANQASFSKGSSISIIATASETNGTIARVYFYEGSVLLGSDSAGQYNYVWTAVPTGTYTLTAVATDINGVSTTSSPITVTVH